MKISKFWFVLLCIFLFLVACDNDQPEGGGTLPEHGEELVADYVSESKKDESGGRILYIKDAPSDVDGEKLWCVHVRYVNLDGINTSPLLVSQRGEEWRIDRNPKRGEWEENGCLWPESNN